MDEFIAKLQKKPIHHRKHITFAVSGGVTAIIFMLWITVVAPRAIQSTIVVAEVPKSKASAQTPIGTIQQSTAAVWGGIKNIFERSNASISNINIDAEYGKVKSQVQNGDIKLIPAPSSQ